MKDITGKSLLGYLTGITVIWLALTTLALAKASDAQTGVWENRESIGRLEERLDSIDARLALIRSDVRELVRRDP